MALSDSKAYDIYEELKYNFLFNNDINCIHILLNLYDLENNINNIFPKYVSIHYLRKRISRLLQDRPGNHLIAYNLGELIHEDVNRLELFLYLEGYKYGYLNNEEINTLENKTLKYFKVSDLYNMKYLFQFDTKNAEIEEYKNLLYENLQEQEKSNKYLYNTITGYTDNVIKRKIISLNKYLDKQLTIDTNLETLNIKEDDTLLPLDELNEIYNAVVKIILKNSQKLYKDAYWNGLNDRVLKRYR
ncbi:MAG TPA: hypothetical protein VK087_07925 [Tissierellaceae bacterium]|nr:hypothetical protein [Tissierellaceae bacterium]